MKIAESEVFYLKENVKGQEDLGCAFQYLFGEDAAYFNFDVKDKDIISPFKEDNEDIWKGDAVEVFLSADGDLTKYKELEVSPYGLRFYADITNKSGFKPSVQKILPAFDAEAVLTEDGYRVAIRLLYDRLPGFDRNKVRFNAFRLDMQKNGKQKLYALSPTFCKSFHRPKYFL